MSPSRPLNIAILLFLFCACNQTKLPIQKDSPSDYKKYWKEYNYATSLLAVTSKSDSAFFHFSHIANNSKDSLLVASSYIEMGIIQNDAGDYYGSQETLLLSLDRLNKKKEQHRIYLGYAYNELGLNSTSLKNFDEAIKYHTNAIPFSNDDSGRLIIMNNIANAYRDKKQYDRALAIYTNVLQDPQNTPMQYARVLSNMTYTKWLKNPDYNAAAELGRAMRIRKNESDERGLIASYQQLSDYYAKTHADSGSFYAHQLYSLAQQLKSPDDELEALSKLIPLSDTEVYKKYFARYKALSDSIQTSRSNAKNQFAVIRYETEKQKADNLVLQKENAETKLRVAWQRVFSVVLAIVAVIGFIWYRKRKQEAMRLQELRTSQKVHDIVANGLYTIINKIEHEEKLGKEQLLDEMEVLYEQSRNISYDREESAHKHSDELIPGLLKSFSTREIRVLIVGYSAALWNRISSQARADIRHALQNLMINMKKHSQAKNVVIRFEEVNNQMKIQYTDDGIGVSAGFRYGNGLSSTETRIKHIGGQLIFDTSAPQGVRIQILIPIEQAQ